MIAVLGGLGAACCWTVTSVFAQRAARTIGELNSFAWACIFGALIVIVPATVSAVSDPPGIRALAALLGAGIFNMSGLLAFYVALRRGQISVVAPIGSAEGAVAALIAVAAGLSLSSLAWAGLVVLAAGLATAALSQRAGKGAGDATGGPVPVGLAVLAALLFGAGLYCQAKAGAEVPLGLAVAPGSIVGAVLFAGPMAAAGRLRLPPRAALPWLLGVAAAEVLGFVSYVLGARASLPVAAVLSAQYASLATLVGVIILGERLTRAQLAGLVLTVAGVAAISLGS